MRGKSIFAKVSNLYIWKIGALYAVVGRLECTFNILIVSTKTVITYGDFPCKRTYKTERIPHILPSYSIESRTDTLRTASIAEGIIKRSILASLPRMDCILELLSLV